MIIKIFDENDGNTAPPMDEEPFIDSGDLDDFIFRGEPVITHSER